MACRVRGHEAGPRGAVAPQPYKDRSPLLAQPYCSGTAPAGPQPWPSSLQSTGVGGAPESLPRTPLNQSQLSGGSATPAGTPAVAGETEARPPALS